MTLKTKFKIICSVALLAVVLFASVPKVYVHALLGHVHNTLHSTSNDAFSENSDTQDCNFEKFDTPVYYTVFKFILNFLPLKETKQTSFYYHKSVVPQVDFNISLVRGPPIA